MVKIMTNARTIEEIKNEIINYFTENEDEFNEVIEELDSYNGYLGDDRYFNMDDLDEMLYGLTPTEVLNRTFYGGDADTKDAQGNRGEFNPNREYFYYNGYGNLVSTDYKDYTYHLDDYFVNNLIENYEQLWDVPEEVIALIEELQKLEENE